MRIIDNYGIWGALVIVFACGCVAFWLVALLLALVGVFVSDGVFFLVSVGGFVLIGAALGMRRIEEEKIIREARKRRNPDKAEK